MVRFKKFVTLLFCSMYLVRVFYTFLFVVNDFSARLGVPRGIVIFLFVVGVFIYQLVCFSLNLIIWCLDKLCKKFKETFTRFNGTFPRSSTKESKNDD